MNRVLNVAAIVVSMVLFLICDQLNAAVVNITQGSTSGYTMTDGNIYFIQDSVSFTNNTVGGSGMTVANNATVVLYVPAGVTLTAIGANGSGRTGGGAGIRVPQTSTLIITGEGMVNATGGNAGDGDNGRNGTNATETYNPNGYGYVYDYGTGGRGGNGGGGAGAGIGGIGGTGGLANNGAGGSAESMGGVYVLGLVRIESFSGACGVAGCAGRRGSSLTYFDIAGDYIATGGGGGGGGGAGASPKYPIGGGGSAGGAGGQGGRGIRNDRFDSDLEWPDTGAGGGSYVQVGDGGSAVSQAGSEGDAGLLYVSPEVTINVERALVSTTTCAVVQYTITFDANGGTLSSESNNIAATLGCVLPDCIPTPIRRGYLLCGWKDDNGTEYYDGNGKKMLTCYSFPGDVVLHAEWVIDPDRMIITPADGTIFEGSLTIAMSSSVEGTTIRYTLDGSDPTIDSPIYKKFKINGKSTVKAVAFYDDGSHSDVVTASYALGQCADPIVSPEDGTVFEHSGLVVTIDQNGEEGVLRYTIDGSDPTSLSAVYTGPFTVDDSTVVKAKVFSDRYFDSAVVTANLTREWETVATPIITAADAFVGSETEVVIACATPGATIRYTTNGSEPTSHSPKYTGAFWVNESCVIKAVATCAEYQASPVVSRTITKVWGIGDTMGAPDHAFTTSGNAGFTRVEDVTAPSGEAMRSGEIGDSAAYGLYTRSVLSTTVQGPGALTFKWRTSCEQDDDYEWDHAEFAVDGVVKARLNDVTEWRSVAQSITGAGEHVVTWTYLKDDSEGAGDDCLWVAGYSWVTDEPYTHESAVSVPYDWILTYFPHTAPEYDRYETAANATAANGRDKVWECFVAGISPTNETAAFTAKIEMRDGAPIVTWEPDLNTNGVIRTYKVYGSETLENGGEWQYPTNSFHRFFKVAVEIP